MIVCFLFIVYLVRTAAEYRMNAAAKFIFSSDRLSRMDFMKINADMRGTPVLYL